MHIATAYTMTIHSIWSSFSFIQNIFSLFYCSCNLSRIKEKRLTTGTTWRASKCIYFWFNLNNHEHNPTLSPYSYYSFNQKRMQKKFLTTQCNLFQLKNVMVSYDLRPKSVHLSFDIIAYILVQSILINCNCDIGYFDELIYIYQYISYLYIYVMSILISFRYISLKEELPSHLLYWFSFILWMNVTWMEIWLSTNMFVCFLISYVTYIIFVLLHFIYIPWSFAF